MLPYLFLMAAAESRPVHCAMQHRSENQRRQVLCCAAASFHVETAPIHKFLTLTSCLLKEPTIFSSAARKFRGAACALLLRS